MLYRNPQNISSREQIYYTENSRLSVNALFLEIPSRRE